VLLGLVYVFIWENGITFAAASLANVSLFRIGLSAYAGLVPESQRQLAETLALAGPEAGWLGIAWQFGAVGLLLVAALFALVGVGAWRAFRDSDDEDVRTLALAGILLIGVTGALMGLSTKLGAVNFTLYFWFFVGLVIAAGRFAAEARR